MYNGNHREGRKGYCRATSAEIFEITPSQPYTSANLNWNNSQSRVSREHSDATLRNVELTTTEVPNWEDYDIVFIGYPIWWGIAAWPTDSFVAANSFEGKTVIPGSKTASHIKDNFDIFDFTLTDDEMNDISAIDKQKRYYVRTPELIKRYAEMVFDVDSQK